MFKIKKKKSKTSYFSKKLQKIFHIFIEFPFENTKLDYDLSCFVVASKITFANIKPELSAFHAIIGIPVWEAMWRKYCEAAVVSS